jgi:hypothetical protein
LEKRTAETQTSATKTFAFGSTSNPPGNDSMAEIEKIEKMWFDGILNQILFTINSRVEALIRFVNTTENTVTQTN